MFIEQILIEVQSLFILDKEKRRVYRKDKLESYINKKVKSKKWGVSYSSFDGEELLEGSIQCIRDSVDYINVVYQTKSWFGNPASENLVQKLQKLKDEGLIDELIEYIPNVKIRANKQELIKRNVGLSAAKKARVNYFMTMDCDEYYLKDEIENAKKFIIKNNITHAFCNIINYAYLPTQRFLESTPSFVQIFSKIKFNSKLSKNNKIITLVDPTRCLNHYIGAKYYFLPKIDMHHMAFVRKDFNKKIVNSSGTIREKVDSISENYINCENIFNINCSDFQC